MPEGPLLHALLAVSVWGAPQHLGRVTHPSRHPSSFFFWSIPSFSWRGRGGVMTETYADSCVTLERSDTLAHLGKAHPQTHTQAHIHTCTHTHTSTDTHTRTGKTTVRTQSRAPKQRGPLKSGDQGGLRRTGDGQRGDGDQRFLQARQQAYRNGGRRQHP